MSLPVKVGGENFPELCAKHTVDQEVDGGIESKENRGDEPKDQDPDRETSKVRASAQAHFFDNMNFMHIEKYTKDIAEKEGRNHHHKNH